MARVRPEQLGWYLSNDLSITGSISESVIISGSNPLTLIGLENYPSASFSLTYNPNTDAKEYYQNTNQKTDGFIPYILWNNYIFSKNKPILEAICPADIGFKLAGKTDEEIVDATKTSFTQYYNSPEDEEEKSKQWNKAVNYITKILVVRKKTKDDPILSELYYCRSILRTKSPYKTDWQILQYLKDLIDEGYDIESIKDTCKSAYNWGDFIKYFSE